MYLDDLKEEVTFGKSPPYRDKKQVEHIGDHPFILKVKGEYLDG
ncbi:hypothetical protein SAMN05192559_108106 [Halobacillus karajensis]|uniref:Uncharacterized protein n=1 Tax=Halobacillus karajensis TaxID=195088 RepID=A0A024P602_9BACI|nr:hypothetical protein BN982_03113 [Halobacillus karajensis]CDQ23772.1 hypothetical protein BN983_02023 [Halobacillus karajensis]CDQ27250.1 hypothetical protein BN981_01504 [Halobacillus karajensis]SEI04762.1 hypothetical protein SAMN05192559_108106 [Halobacillus karajensis]